MGTVIQTVGQPQTGFSRLGMQDGRGVFDQLRLINLQQIPWCRLGHNSRVQQGFRIPERGSIAAGQFRGIDLHQAIVDPQAGKGRQQMLRHLHRGGSPNQFRAPLFGSQKVNQRRNQRLVGQIHPLKYNAMMFTGGQKTDAHFRIREQAVATQFA